MAFVFEGKTGKWNLGIGDLIMFKFSSDKTLSGLVEKIQENKVNVKVAGKDHKEHIRMLVRRKSIISAVQNKKKNNELNTAHTSSQ